MIIYAPVGFKVTWQKYQEICNQNGTNASREIRKFVKNQVARRDFRRAHREDDPQTRLEKYKQGKSLPSASD